MRIIETIGGLNEGEIFQNPQFVRRLRICRRAASRTVHSVDIAVRQTLKNVEIDGLKLSEKRKAEESNRPLSRVIDAKVFRIGFEFQCSTCSRRNWYATTEFAGTYSCKSCFAQEKTPHIHEMEWHFSSDGLFRNGKNLDGNITVLLAFSFFQEIYSFDGLKYAPSFLYSLGNDENEMDFAIIGESFRPDTDMIFGEAKTGATLDEEERAKLRAFGVRTNAYICFCTLLEDFRNEDKEYFKQLYRDGVKIILIPGRILGLDDDGIAEFRSRGHERSATEADWLMRQTMIATLGDEFAREQGIWV